MERQEAEKLLSEIITDLHEYLHIGFPDRKTLGTWIFLKLEKRGYGKRLLEIETAFGTEDELRTFVCDQLMKYPFYERVSPTEFKTKQ